MDKKQALNDPRQKQKTGKKYPGTHSPETSPWYEERFRAFFNSIKDAVFVHPYLEEGFAPFIEVNDTACERYGYTREEFQKLTASDITVPVDVERHGKTDSRKRLLDNRRVVFETTHIKKSGEKIPVEINSNIIEQNGEVLILAVVRDITERRLADEALRESEERYRSMFQGSHAVMLIIDPENFDIVDVNPAAVSFYGYSIEKIRKMNISELNMLSDEEISGIVDKIKNDKQSHLFLRHRLANGDVRDVEVYTGPIRMRGKVLLLSIVHDITEHKKAEAERSKLEARLQQAEKMEAIGTLAGGVAHEFNNILGIIMGNNQLAMDEISDTDPARDFLNEISRASIRAKNIVKNILNFARKSLNESTPIKISEVISESVGLIRSTTPAMIEIRQNIGCRDVMILGDATEVSQVVINLCNNAVQAIADETGVLEISLKPVTLDQKSVTGYEELQPGRYVRLTVKDSGCGIAPDIMGRIFDPYFSTGSLAERSGMGLSICHGIVKKYEGAITVESTVGNGTTVEVLFPVIEEKGKNKELSGGEAGSGNDRKSILFVDDEESLIIIWKKILQNWGYDVETSASSLRALELFKSDPGHFDLVISDIGMPHMPGDKLAQEIIKIRGNIPIIICTGYSDRINEEKAMAMGISRYITKPINIEELEISIKEVLGIDVNS